VGIVPSLPHSEHVKILWKSIFVANIYYSRNALTFLGLARARMPPNLSACRSSSAKYKGNNASQELFPFPYPHGKGTAAESTFLLVKGGGRRRRNATMKCCCWAVVGNYTFELMPVHQLACGSNIGKLADQEFNLTGQRDIK
jgi:hypothetical protein